MTDLWFLFPLAAFLLLVAMGYAAWRAMEWFAR